MNTAQLVDYLINADLVVQLANDDLATIEAQLAYDEIEVSADVLTKAIAKAKLDPFVQRFSKRDAA